MVGGVIGGGAKIPATIGSSVEADNKDKANKKGEICVCVSALNLGNV